MTLLRVDGLRKHFGGVRAVDGVSFALGAGEVLAVIGPNGAGKSTLFNLVNGQLRPDAGSIRLDGQELVGRSPRQLWRRGVARTFQIAATFGSMTALENVQTAILSRERRLHDLWSRARLQHREEARALLADVGMEAAADRPCSELAYGDVKRIELAVALAGRPRLLLMDEPTAGMAPAERSALMLLTRRFVAERRVAVLFTEHDMDIVFEHAGRILVLARGEVIAEGDPAAIRDDARVQAVYFGSGKLRRATRGGAA